MTHSKEDLLFPLEPWFGYLLSRGSTSTQETASQHPSAKRPGTPESPKTLSLGTVSISNGQIIAEICIFVKTGMFVL